jgi:hypothetical protein
MASFLSRLNRRRLFVRQERRANRIAAERQANLDAEERAEIGRVLDRFAPQPCGQRLIRMGPKNDGGYLIPDDLEGIAALYSPGVSDTLGFDLEIAKMGINCFLADGTVDQPSDMHPNMRFEKKMIGRGPADQYMSLESWVSRTAPSEGDLMLQMDIEGAEYEVFIDTPQEVLDRFRIIVIEVHRLENYVFGKARQQLSGLLDRLQHSHTICHLHPNTVAPPVDIIGRKVPPLVELTLLRNDRVTGGTEKGVSYPHVLDAPNRVHLPKRDFPAFWVTE